MAKRNTNVFILRRPFLYLVTLSILKPVYRVLWSFLPRKRTHVVEEMIFGQETVFDYFSIYLP